MSKSKAQKVFDEATTQAWKVYNETRKEKNGNIR